MISRGGNSRDQKSDSGRREPPEAGAIVPEPTEELVHASAVVPEPLVIATKKRRRIGSQRRHEDLPLDPVIQEITRQAEEWECFPHKLPPVPEPATPRRMLGGWVAMFKRKLAQIGVEAVAEVKIPGATRVPDALEHTMLLVAETIVQR